MSYSHDMLQTDAAFAKLSDEVLDSLVAVLKAKIDPVTLWRWLSVMYSPPPLPVAVLAVKLEAEIVNVSSLQGTHAMYEAKTQTLQQLKANLREQHSTRTPHGTAEPTLGQRHRQHPLWRRCW